jgi:hypothetical protein
MTTRQRGRQFTTENAVDIGREGGLARTEKKAASSRANGAQGGRPRKPLDSRLIHPVAVPDAFLWERIEAALRARGPLTLEALKAEVAEHTGQNTDRRIDAVILTEIRRRPELFKKTRAGFVALGEPTVKPAPAVCAWCGGPMPAPTRRRQSAPWRATYCRRWCARAAEHARYYREGPLSRVKL